MKRILIAWELGGGLGHVMRAAALARAFSVHGCVIHVALRDLADCSLTQWPEGTVFLQAPVSFRLPAQFTNPATYAELLYINGYHDARLLDGLTAGWTSMMELLEPDIVVADHAPTAILAAKIMGIPSVRLGTGFFAPPMIQPFPSFRIWEDFDALRAQNVEAYVLSTVNAVIQGAQLQFSSVAQALNPDVDLISSWPELDHYADQRNGMAPRYVGNETTVGAQSKTEQLWETRPQQKRLLVYLKHDYKSLEHVMAGLAGCRDHVHALVYVAGFTVAQAQAACTENITVSTQPLTLHHLLQDVHGVVCHAGSGTVALCLEYGVPVLLLPYTAEQYLYAKQVVKNHFGVMQSDLEVREGFSEKLIQFLADSTFSQAIQAAQIRNRDLPQDAIAASVERCMHLVHADSLSA